MSRAKSRISLAAISFAVAVACSPVVNAVALESSYLPASRLDLARLLPPPPAPDSEQQKQDIKAVLDAQAARTPAQVARANETEQLSVFGFADVLGPSFNKDKLPRTAAFFQQIYDDTLDVLKGAKDRWKRPRPFVASSAVQPSAEKPKSTSYPSGNALLGQLYAIVLSDLIPEKSTQFFARGRETGDNRLLAGVHFPSDIEAGRQAAVAVAFALSQAPGYRSDLEAARSELRSVLGL